MWERKAVVMMRGLRNEERERLCRKSLMGSSRLEINIEELKERVWNGLVGGLIFAKEPGWSLCFLADSRSSNVL